MVDRERERAELEHLLAAGAPRMALLYGRRRVGKTFLLTNVWPEERTFYFTASNVTPEQNRQALVAEVARWSGQGLRQEDYSTWRNVFRLLLDLQAPEPVAVVLDEFQYLGKDEKDLAGVASELNAAWEARRAPRPFVLTLSGSAVRIMEALSEGGAPLHGRFAWKHRLEPFDYWYAAQMASFRQLRERAMAYGVYGGIPRYLAATQRAAAFGQNVARTMLSPRGEVRMQVETALLQEQGLRETAKYHAILRAIAEGRTELNEIAQGAGLDNDTGLRDKIARLVTLGYVQGRRNLGAKAKEPYRYRLADPPMLFYQTFVTRLETELERSDPLAVWREHVEPLMADYMGGVFERMAEQAYYRLREAWRLPMVREWGRWEGVDRDGASLEMDIASHLTGGDVLTGQVKWNERPIPPGVHTHHMGMLERLARSAVKWAHQALRPSSPILYIAAGGFSEPFMKLVEAERATGRTVVTWTLEELYSTPQRRRPIRPTGVTKKAPTRSAS